MEINDEWIALGQTNAVSHNDSKCRSGRVAGNDYKEGSMKRSDLGRTLTIS
jgi:hypothetical protein